MRPQDIAVERQNVDRVVALFARRLRRRLLEPRNVRKGGWRSMTGAEIWEKMLKHTDALDLAVDSGLAELDTVRDEIINLAAYETFFGDPRRDPARWRGPDTTFEKAYAKGRARANVREAEA